MFYGDHVVAHTQFKIPGVMRSNIFIAFSYMWLVVVVTCDVSQTVQQRSDENSIADEGTGYGLVILDPGFLPDCTMNNTSKTLPEIEC